MQKSQELTSAVFRETHIESIEKNTAFNFTSFRNTFMKEFKVIKGFAKSVERKFEELENANRFIGAASRKL